MIMCCCLACRRTGMTRDRILQIRVTSAELDIFRDAARLVHRSVSNWAVERLARLASEEVEAAVEKK